MARYKLSWVVQGEKRIIEGWPVAVGCWGAVALMFLGIGALVCGIAGMFT